MTDGGGMTQLTRSGKNCRMSGGSVTFDRSTTSAWRRAVGLPQIAWGAIPGAWLKPNQDKFALAEAIERGMIRQTETGYELVRP